MRQTRDMDYLRWARRARRRLQRPLPHRPRTRTAATASWRSAPTSPAALAGGRPWLLMEHSTSAVNWQPRNLAKRPGEMLRNSLPHVARGADGVLFFQWRASRAGAEKFHSAMLPHAGTDTRHVARGRRAVPGARRGSRRSAGSAARNDAAILFDYEAWWGCELDSHPTIDVRYRDRAEDLHRALSAQGVGVDVVHPAADLSAYRLVVVPTLYLVDRRHRRCPRRRQPRPVRRSLVTYFSGIVDEHDHIRLGGYPGAFRELLGVRTDEFLPLLRASRCRSTGSATAPYRRRLGRGPGAGRRRGGRDVRRRPRCRASPPSPAGRSARAPRGTSPRASTPAAPTGLVGAAGRRDRHRDAARRHRPGRGHPPGRRRRELALRHQPRRRTRPGRRARASSWSPAATSPATCRCPRAAWPSCGSA